MPPAQLLCLANSRKHNGKCVAGKLLVDGQPTKWIRPVGTGQAGEVDESFVQFPGFQRLEVLDVFSIELLSHKPDGHQVENYAFDPNKNWTYLKKVPKSVIDNVIENPASLWLNGYHSTNGSNDFVPENELVYVGNSLYLIRPNCCIIRKILISSNKLQIRFNFYYKNIKYDLVVTDPVVESCYRDANLGDYPVDNVSAICVSLGEVFNRSAYKLVASIIC